MFLNLSIFRYSNSVLSNSPLFAGRMNLDIKKSMFSRITSPLICNVPFLKVSKSTFKQSLAPLYIENQFIDQRRYYNGKITEKFSDLDNNHELIFDNVLFTAFNINDDDIISVSTSTFHCSCSNFYKNTVSSSILALTYTKQSNIKFCTFKENTAASLFNVRYSTFGSKVSSVETCTACIFKSEESSLLLNSANITNSQKINSGALILQSQDKAMKCFEYCSLVKSQTTSILNIRSDSDILLRNSNFLENSGVIFELKKDFPISNCVFNKNAKITESLETPVGYEFYLLMYGCHVDAKLSDLGPVKGYDSQFGTNPAKITFDDITYLYKCSTYTPTPACTPQETPFSSPFSSPFITPFITPHVSPKETPWRTPVKSPLASTPPFTTYHPPRSPERTVQPTPGLSPVPTVPMTPPPTPLPSTPPMTALPTSTPEPTTNTDGILFITVPAIIVVLLIPLIVFASLRIFREMSSNNPIMGADYVPFLSTGSSSDVSSNDPFDFNSTDDDDDEFRNNHEMFVPRLRDMSVFMPKDVETKKREDIVYGFLK